MTTSITGQGISVCLSPDDELSLTSKKPAQNKVITNALNAKQNAPSTAGTAGQVLGLNGSLQPVWVNQSGGGGGGGSLTPEIKQAMLQIARNVSYFDHDQKNKCYKDFHDALFPPDDLISISAVFNQDGQTYYAYSPLSSLKSCLVVTASFMNGGTEIAFPDDYILSGELLTGVSTITVTYYSMTTTFDVIVTENVLPIIAAWNFSDSLTDTINGTVASTYNELRRGSDGLYFNGASQCIDLGEVYQRNRTFEIDITDWDMRQSDGSHIRVLMYGTGGSTTTGLLLWRAASTASGWSAYTGNWSSLYAASTDLSKNAFANSTLKVEVDSDGLISLYVNGVFIGQSNVAATSTTQHLYIGNTDSPTSGGYMAYARITGFRVFEGVA